LRQAPPDLSADTVIVGLAGRKSFYDPALERIGRRAGAYGYDLAAQAIKAARNQRYPLDLVWFGRLGSFRRRGSKAHTKKRAIVQVEDFGNSCLLAPAIGPGPP
jgi:hypothetical protein